MTQTDETLERLNAAISWLAKSGMKHDMFDNVYAPLLAVRDRMFPDWWDAERQIATYLRADR